LTSSIFETSNFRDLADLTYHSHSLYINNKRDLNNIK